MLQDILELKLFILERLLQCKVMVSAPSIRTINSSARKTNTEFINLLKKQDLHLIMHDSIKKEVDCIYVLQRDSKTGLQNTLLLCFP